MAGDVITAHEKTEISGWDVMRTQTDIIKFEEHSIYASGYGFAPKFLTQDTELSIAAKAVYLYFCSLTGGNYSVYPTRAQILYDLGIGKDKYYAAMENLTEQNYIHISKEKATANKFEHNIYHLNLNPKRYMIDDKLSGDTIVVDGLLSGGSGMLSYRVMKSRAISCTEKVIYGYIVSFMGAGNTRMPARDEILVHLGISEKTYKRSIAKLSALELVKYSHVRDKFGRVAGGRYEVILTPTTWTSVSAIPLKEQDESVTEDRQTEPRGQIGDTQNELWGQNRDTQNEPGGQIGDTQNEPGGQIGDTQNEPGGQIGDTQNGTMGSKRGHYHNNNISSIYNTTTTKDINKLLILKLTSKTDEDVVEVFEEYIKSSMNKQCLSDPERMVIEYISELFIFNQGVKSKGLERPYEYLESKTIRAIEENSFAKTINRIVELYEKNKEPISYPQGWVQSVYARIIGTTQWDITLDTKKRPPKPLNAFQSFPQRETDYDSLVLEQMKLL
ncbi:helix-turn-helix domain-containing protein [Lacrimispora amygdalina]|uniref:helix-turn-helix domain-containing protein n=1 Tax=Lacrimispora amygdalina TaxID=253257 RepID=UPI000BE3E7DD|nr:helix-turn-helix domain-containing protein [Lacrimispora amygdalina]